MTVPGYTLSSLYLPNTTGQPFTVDDADRLIGHEVQVSVHDVVLACGIVIAASCSDGGQWIAVNVESGGRSCAACHAVFTVQVAERELVPLEQLRSRLSATMLSPMAPAYEKLSGRAMVCRFPDTCNRNRMDLMDDAIERARDEQEDGCG